MRKQYFFRQTPRGLAAWDVDHLVELSRTLPRRRIPLTQIAELDEPWSASDEAATWRGFVQHAQLMHDADLSYPIILAADGRVMDGMHRVARALMLGHGEIIAVQFQEDPPPDHIGNRPLDLPYDERP